MTDQKLTPPSKKWNITLRKLLSESTGVKPSSICKGWQMEGLASLNEFISFNLSRQTMLGRPYDLNAQFNNWYNLEYIVSIYGLSAFDKARMLIEFVNRQAAKDILYPVGMSFQSGFVIADFTEKINGRAYNRTDVDLTFSAYLSVKDTKTIETLNINFIEG